MRHENNEKLTELLCRWKHRAQGRHTAGLQPHAIPVIISVNNHITMPRQPQCGSRESGQWQSNPKLSKLSLSSDHRSPCQELQRVVRCMHQNTCPPHTSPARSSLHTPLSTALGKSTWLFASRSASLSLYLKDGSNRRSNSATTVATITRILLILLHLRLLRHIQIARGPIREGSSRRAHSNCEILSNSIKKLRLGNGSMESKSKQISLMPLKISELREHFR